MSDPRPAASRARVDILILNWNGWRDTLECLESVFQLDHPFRVVLCDNGSTDCSMEQFREWARGALEPSITGSPLRKPLRPDRDPVPFVEYDRESAEGGGDAWAASASLVLINTGANLGFAGGNNVGLRFLLAEKADGFVWLLNNDMVVQPDTLSRMMTAAARMDAAGIGATLLEYSHPGVVQAAGGGKFVAWQGLPRPHSAAGALRGSAAAQTPDRLDFISMGCMLMPLSIVRRVGLIDERFFMYCEDIDYSIRIGAAGGRIGFAPDAELWHKGSATAVAGSAAHDYNMIRSSLLLVRKVNPWGLPMALLYSTARCIMPKLARGEWHRLGASTRALIAGASDSMDVSPATSRSPLGR